MRAREAGAGAGGPAPPPIRHTPTRAKGSESLDGPVRAKVGRVGAETAWTQEIRKCRHGIICAVSWWMVRTSRSRGKEWPMKEHNSGGRPRKPSLQPHEHLAVECWPAESLA